MNKNKQASILIKSDSLIKPYFLYRFSLLAFVIVVILATNHTYANTVYYVAVSGKPSGNGSLKTPWDLQTALNQPSAVKPGDTIYLKAGTYVGTFTSNLTGSINSPIILKNNPGGRAIIDGSLAGQSIKNIAAFTIKGAYTWYCGLEVTNSDTSRILMIPGSNPPERRGTGVDVFGPGIKVINFIVYDTGAAFGAWSPAINSEYYGNIIFNNGWYAPDRGHGHGVYTQNNTGTKTYIDNVILNNFGDGWHVYGSGNAQLKNFYFEGNVTFNDRWLIGGIGPLQNIELNTNFSYKDRPQLGYTSQQNDGLVLQNNFFASGIAIYWWKNVKATGNTFFAGSTTFAPISILNAGEPDLSSFHFDGNTYYSPNASSTSSRPLSFSWTNTSADPKDVKRSGLFNLSEWHKIGQDVHSNIEYLPVKDIANLKLNGNKIFVRKNKYDAKRTTIVVYNWDQSNAVNANVSGILSEGDVYELRNVENYFGDIITARYKGGGTIAIPMTGHTVAKPWGYDQPLGPNTFPEFGTFILIKK